jgi:hypothetical protein
MSSKNNHSQAPSPPHSAPKRCKHPRAYLRELTETTVVARCDDCVLEWYGPPYEWVSPRHPLHRTHKPPRWVMALIDRQPQRRTI